MNPSLETSLSFTRLPPYMPQFDIWATPSIAIKYKVDGTVTSEHKAPLVQAMFGISVISQKKYIGGKEIISKNISTSQRSECVKLSIPVARFDDFTLQPETVGSGCILPC